MLYWKSVGLQSAAFATCAIRSLTGVQLPAPSRGGSGANGFAVKDDRAMPQFVPIEELFKGRHFDQEIVILCVRWYLSFKLSYRIW